MANSKVIIEIQTTSKGLKIAAKDTEQLAKGVEMTGAAYVGAENLVRNSINRKNLYINLTYLVPKVSQK